MSYSKFQNLKSYAILILLVFSLLACKKKGCMDPLANNYNEKAKKDDGTCEYPPSTEITFKFINTFDLSSITTSQFNQLNYTNEFGSVLSFSKLRYQISDFYFYTSATDSVNLNNYHLVDASDASSLTYKIPTKILQNKYSAVSFVFGFEPSKNISGNYADLNAANWGWPVSLGGGYHSLQIEGSFIKTTTDTLGYAFHCGSATREINGTDTTYHPNYFRVKLAFTEMQFDDAVSIELKMNIAEWFKNPNTWDLNTLNNSLMGNYNAQIMMKANGADVFTIGTIEP